MESRRAIGLCFAATLFFAASCGEKQRTISSLPGCQAAVAKVDYGSALSVPQETRDLIESYRADWRAFCGGEGKPTLADLLVKAKEIETQFDKVVDTFNQGHNDETFEQRAPSVDAVSELLVKKYPVFVPAFEGSIWELEYFRPVTEEFKKHASLGSAEDKLFFDSGVTLHTVFPAWMDRTWDYGGCWKFGEYDWTSTLKRIAELKKSLRSDIYKSLASEYEAALIEPLTQTSGRVCACKRKEAVLEDLRGVLTYLEKEPAFSAHVPLVRSSVEAHEAKKITLGSQAEAHCSGG